MDIWRRSVKMSRINRDGFKKAALNDEKQNQEWKE
jgi:hypothetical protein